MLALRASKFSSAIGSARLVPERLDFMVDLGPAKANTVRYLKCVAIRFAVFLHSCVGFASSNPVHAIIETSPPNCLGGGASDVLARSA